MGKGSHRRPGDDKALRQNWDRVFGPGSRRKPDLEPPAVVTPEPPQEGQDDGKAMDGAPAPGPVARANLGTEDFI